MRRLLVLLLIAVTCTTSAQLTLPYNPDGNGDGLIAVYDLQDLLSAYGLEFQPGEIVVDSIPLSAYLEALELMIQLNGLPQGDEVGQIVQWDGESWTLVAPSVGCTNPLACNFDAVANILLASLCIYPDVCGVCGGPGAVYDCGCSGIAEGECDCDGNVLDALNVCGGGCSHDLDADGICDDADSCVGQADECGVCNGPGAIFSCGCTGIPEGNCDCNGNQADALGVCGGSCLSDDDSDGICDDVDDCVGAYDVCGVCNGQGPTQACGCEPIPEGACNCEGAVADAIGTCGGGCQIDYNQDGICDDDNYPGCTYPLACNFDPSALFDDGSCEFDSCVVTGCTDSLACNYFSFATNEDYSCVFPGCTDSQACNFVEDAGCDDGSCVFPGCTNPEACNYNPESGCDDGSCALPGCTDPNACNYNMQSGCDDGSCEYSNFGCTDPSACNYDDWAECDDGSCGVFGCTNDLACNYLENAACDDGSCTYPGCQDATAFNYDSTAGCPDECLYEGCTYEYACNFDPIASIEDGSCIFGECSGCTIPEACNFNPTVTVDDGSCTDCCEAFQLGYSLSIKSEAAVQEGLTRWQFFVNMVNPTDRMSSVFGNDQAEMFLSVPEGAYNSPFNSSWNASGINPVFLTVFPELADDTFATIGLGGPSSTSGIAGAADPSIVEDSAQPITPFFGSDGATTLESNTLTGSSWYILNTAANGLPDAECGQVQILQVTIPTGSDISGRLNVQIFPEGVGANQEQLSFSFNSEENVYESFWLINPD